MSARGERAGLTLFYCSQDLSKSSFWYLERWSKLKSKLLREIKSAAPNQPQKSGIFWNESMFATVAPLRPGKPGLLLGPLAFVGPCFTLCVKEDHYWLWLWDHFSLSWALCLVPPSSVAPVPPRMPDPSTRGAGDPFLPALFAHVLSPGSLLCCWLKHKLNPGRFEWHCCQLNSASWLLAFPFVGQTLRAKLS